jgi:hypothetical protein
MKPEKVYNSIGDFAKEFTKNFSYVPDEIKELWDSIINYADLSMDLGAEGNSGEFHDPKEEKAIIKERQEKENELTYKFGRMTGYEPFFVKNKEYPIYIRHGKHMGGVEYAGAWDFKEVAKTPEII